MPFGLCNAFQRLMNTILAGQWESCLVYLDDIIIVGRMFEEHLLNLEQVLQCLKLAGLKLQPKKCHFCKQQVAFLGHLVSGDGVATDQDKISAVKQWPIAKSVHEVTIKLLSSFY